jgi:hypothetical protein
LAAAAFNLSTISTALAEFQSVAEVGNAAMIKSLFDGVSLNVPTPLPSLGYSAVRSFQPEAGNVRQVRHADAKDRPFDAWQIRNGRRSMSDRKSICDLEVISTDIGPSDAIAPREPGNTFIATDSKPAASTLTRSKLSSLLRNWRLQWLP